METYEINKFCLDCQETRTVFGNKFCFGSVLDGENEFYAPNPNNSVVFVEFDGNQINIKENSEKNKPTVLRKISEDSVKDFNVYKIHESKLVVQEINEYSNLLTFTFRSAFRQISYRLTPGEIYCIGNTSECSIQNLGSKKEKNAYLAFDTS
jgi:hypothetical protein